MRFGGWGELCSPHPRRIPSPPPGPLVLPVGLVPPGGGVRGGGRADLPGTGRGFHPRALRDIRSAGKPPRAAPWRVVGRRSGRARRGFRPSAGVAGFPRGRPRGLGGRAGGGGWGGPGAAAAAPGAGKAVVGGWALGGAGGGGARTRAPAEPPAHIFG